MPLIILILTFLLNPIILSSSRRCSSRLRSWLCLPIPRSSSNLHHIPPLHRVFHPALDHTQYLQSTLSGCILCAIRGSGGLGCYPHPIGGVEPAGFPSYGQ